MLRFLKLSRSAAAEDAVPTPDLSRIFPELRAAKAAEAAAAVSPHDHSAAGPDAPEGLDADWLRRDIAALRAAHADALASPEQPALRALFLCAHNLKGAAEPLGHPAVSRLAASLCRILEARGANAPADPLTGLHIDAMTAAAHGGDAAEALADAVCVALEDRVSAVLRG